MISVIIPLYNSQDYLRRCLDSIIIQNFIEFEIILINDGSTDLSQQICQEYIRKDSRIKLINNRSNEGLSRARQAGMDRAEGDYILFVDSDDWIEPNALKVMYDAAQLTGAEIITFGFKIWTTNDKYKIFNRSYDDKNQLLSSVISNELGVVWRNLIKKDFIDKNDITFPQNLTAGEDYAFMVKCIYYADCITVITDVLYNYVSSTPNSVMNAPNVNSAESQYFATETVISLLRSRKVADSFERELAMRKMFVKNKYLKFGIEKWYNHYPEMNTKFWNMNLGIPLCRRVAYSLLKLLWMCKLLQMRLKQ